MKRLWVALPALLLLTDTAHSHWGHLGELAGHGHWIAVGAVIVAGALAGVLGTLKDNEGAQEDEPVADDAEGEPV